MGSPKFPASHAIVANSEAILRDWHKRMSTDPEFRDVVFGNVDFVRALGATVEVPQIATEGPLMDWRVAVGELLSSEPVHIGIFGRHLLHLEDAALDVLEQNLSSSEYQAGAQRIARAVYWALESAARQLATTLDHAAHRDGLTNLYNKAAFEDHEKRLIEESDTIICVFVDMDGLKAINDSFGHKAGDEAIQELATNLSKLAWPGVQVYRWGGDEFAVLAASHEDAGMVGDQLISELDELRARSRQSFSYGLGSWPAEGEWEDVKQLADARMYREKAGRKRVGCLTRIMALVSEKPRGQHIGID
jgi:diguanylate cyclase (GGDEF)-like protein